MKALTQFYSVDVLTVDGRKIRFDGQEPIACQMIPLDSQRCQFIATNSERALDGILDFASVYQPGFLKYIEYTIIGSPDGVAVGVQRYSHKFTTPVRLSASGIATAENGALFLPYQMDVLLDTRKFGKVQGIQFIA
jgi:hypothetical protein